jgi:hypothetical protein
MLTRENYFDQENEMEYFGSTQIKSFMKCEAETMAKIRGEYVPEKSIALMVGSYVDAHFEGTLDLFKAQHPEILKRDGSLKSEYLQADEIINRVERDSMFMKYMSGEKQVIKTGELFGHKFKIRMDSYHPGKAIVDLKVMRDFEPKYVEGMGKVNFVEAWGYDFQAAIYQAIEGNNLPFIIAGATKQKDGADIGLFRIPQYKIDSALKIIEYKIDHIADVKNGLIEPNRCESCAYCRATKVLKSVEILEDIENE